MKRYFLYIYGCQLNLADAERLAQVLEDLGYVRAAKVAEANLVVIVACSVRQKAVDKLFGLAKNLKKLKLKPQTILTGCVAPTDKLKFKNKFDLVIEIKELINLPRYLKNKSKSKRQQNYLSLLPLYHSTFQAYIPVMTGCNNFCAYCIVPYVRGREYSRPAGEVIKEVAKLIKAGYKEITLVGQNVNSYAYQKYDFPKLLKTIDQLPGQYWLRFLTSHPKDLSKELIAVMKAGRHLTPYLHLPLQAGDDQILRKMNRGYTVKQYLALIKQVRQAVPGLAITTDIIVGFPTETKKQFAQTKKVFKQIGYDMAYLSQYSPRPSTAAARLVDDVVPTEKKRRWQELNQLLKQSSLKANRRWLGKETMVLVDQVKADNKLVINFAKTIDLKNVKFTAAKSHLGQFVKVKIVKINDFNLLAEVIR
ncbi:MAG: tRNA (N6-isopentenyl adenosine(37)-C2)-methylthiotransferase MiaB [Candidatus Buchananbacteria bacterium]